MMLLLQVLHRPMWLYALAVCTLILRPIHAQTGGVLPAPLMLQDHGVAHAMLPLVLHDQQTHAAEAGVLHVFIKAVQHDTSSQQLMEVKGVAYFDVASGIQYCRPKAKRVAPGPWRGQSSAAPEFYIASAQDPEKVVQLERVAEDRVTPSTPCMPLLLRANVTQQSAMHHEWHLHVSDAPQLVVPLLDMQRRAAQQRDPSYITMLGQYFVANPLFGARLVHTHVEWHRRLGFLGSLLVAHAPFVAGLRGQELLRPHIELGRLVMMEFDAYPLNAAYRGYDQAVIENVALLRLWGTNTWILSIDVDEVLMPQVQENDIASLIGRGCMSSSVNDLGMRYILRKNVACSSCAKCGKTQGDGACTTRDGLAFLHQYDLVQADHVLHPKVLIHSMDVQRFHVHDGEGHAEHVMINDTQCAYLAHMVNLHSWRKDPQEEGFVNMNAPLSSFLLT